ncbi:VOC family protein [Microbacterium sp.]|uniref:VOC family protein n=1 Tax=Microbacterium sp. TaxID=51671 RepID=UPI002E305D24|nr:VOC family protein [Microbacterium sp.]HEX5729523.1 VOC family protein [Microbacterium sp.]
MVDLFAGFPVTDYDRSLQWYRRLLGTEPSFYPNDREAVWEVGAHCYVYFEVLPERAGGSLSMLMVEDIDATVAEIAARGVEPLRIEEYEEGMRKVVFQDPDGNELSFGGSSAAES